jgi:hypothetical protein
MTGTGKTVVPGTPQQIAIARVAHRCTRVARLLGHVLAMGIVTMGASGCTATDRPHEHSLYVWPLADILHSLERNESLAGGSNMVLPEGISPRSIIAPLPDGTSSLRVEPAFAEGKTAAYITTDVWLNIPQVWLQPAYVAVEDWSEPPTAVPGSPILIDVGTRSLFYSPFWNMRLAVVGPGFDPNQYFSTRQLLDARPVVPIRPGGWHNYPIVPVGFVPSPPGTRLVDPIWGFDLGEIATHYARFDGEVSELLDLGPGSFDADEGGLIEALPFFIFSRRGAGGELISVDAPRVAGVGPLWSGRSPIPIHDPVTQLTRPRLGMFWLLVLAVMPAGSEVFHLEAHPRAVAGAVTAGVDIRELEGRVATNAACLEDGSFPTGCAWLDSQARIESTLGTGGIVATKLTVNSTFVSFDKRPVSH